MKAREIIFVETGSASDFIRLAAHLDGEINNDTITINNDTWTGSIKKIRLEKGLHLQLWNCRLSSPALLYYYPAPASCSAICTLAYNLNPGSVIIRRPTLPNVSLFQADTFFINNSSLALFELVPRKKIQFICLSMTREWIVRHFDPINADSNRILEQYTNTSKEPFVASSSADEYIAASELFEKIITVPVSPTLFVQSKIFLLLSAFFERLLIRKEIAVEHYEYFKRIRQAEITLNTHLGSSLPSLKDIAEKTGLSESGLKRYFKIIYGNNIYEYYLQQKMELAKRMLVEKNLNVNEVALQLGYENVSSFIEGFKKHFGYLPGVIRKKN